MLQKHGMSVRGHQDRAGAHHQPERAGDHRGRPGSRPLPAGERMQTWIDDDLGHDSGLKNHVLRRGYEEHKSARIGAIYYRWVTTAREIMVRSGLLDDSAPQASKLGE